MEDSTMQLFAIRDTKTGRVLPNEVFENKKTAKVRRNALNEDVGFDRYKVTKGKDHKLYNGERL